jgi:hypothetical protein
MWMLALAMLATAPGELEAAQAACEKSLDACRVYNALRAQAEAEEAARADAAVAEQRAKAEVVKQHADAQAAEDQAREDALRKKCGADYGRVRVGMKWERVRQCAGEFSLTGEDERGQIYEAAAGLVRVERGRVVRWVAR